MAFLAILCEITSAQQWQKLNGPYGGTVVSLYINRTNGNIFAGTEGNELYRSTDDGNTWDMINSGGPFMQHPNDYALNSSGKMFVACDNGVFVTADNGNSFTKITGDATNQFVTGIVVNSHDKIICCKDPTGIFISTDNGNTWTESNTGLDEKRVSSLIITPNQSVFAGTSKGIYRSDDNGATWTSKNNGLSTQDVGCLAFNLDGVIFAGTSNGFFKSIDNGETWTLAIQGMTSASICSISVSPSQNLYACDANEYIYYSNNNGDSWARIDKRDTPPLYLYFSYIYCSAVIADNQLLVGRGYLGIQKTTDNGANWSWSTTGINGASVNDFTVNKNGYIFASIKYQGIFLSTNGGNTWNISENGYSSIKPAFKVFKTIIHSSNGVLYAGSDGMGIYVSENNGASWTERNNGLTNLYIRGLAIHPNGNLFAATASGGIFVSTDNGYTWTYSYASSLEQRMRTIFIKPDGTIFASTYGTGPSLYRSTDCGITWTQSGTEGKPSSPFSLAANSSGHIFAGAPYGGMYISTDNGDTWTLSSTGDFNATVIASNGTIISGKRNIHKSIDNGATWIDLKPISTFSETNCMAFDSSNDLIMGTECNGLYKTSSAIVACESYAQIPNSYSLMQNYPNPFNPATTIKYEIKQSGYITLRVFDSIGREIALLVNEEKSPGTYQVNFNAKNLPSGVYYYQLTSGTYSETKKLVLLK
jgi:photosystem II stability/assembly factor-like uncharacterized protein